MALSNEEIVEWVEQLEKESKALKQEALKFCWFMRGGLTYTEAMSLSGEERKIIADIINENIEISKKTGQPFF